jgi:hypothetical protein
MNTSLRGCVFVLALLGASLAMPPLQPPAIAASQPAAKHTGKPLSYLAAKVGSEPYSLWATQPLHSRLQALLGASEYAVFIRNMNPCGAIEQANGILSTSGNAPHRGYEEEAVLLIDPEKDVIEVIIMHGGKAVRAWAEKDTSLPLPPSISETLQHWPQPALKAALAQLSPTSAMSPASGPATSPAAPSGGVLDDINSVFAGDRPSPAHTPGSALPAKESGKSVAGASASSQVIEKIGQQLDIAGIRLGMPASVAVAAVRGIDPRLQMRPDTFSFHELPNLKLTGGINFVSISTGTREDISLGLTLSPKLSKVWGTGQSHEHHLSPKRSAR